MPTEEIVASAIAAAVAVVGVMKGLSYLTEKRHERNGTERFMTCAQCREYRGECAASRLLMKTDANIDRAELKADTKAWRISAEAEMEKVNFKIDSMENGFKQEILELGKKIDKFCELISKKPRGG